MNITDTVLRQVTNPSAAPPVALDLNDPRIRCWADPPHCPPGTVRMASDDRALGPVGLCAWHHLDLLGRTPDTEPAEQEAC